MKRFAIFCLLALLVTLSAVAADLNGKWSGKFEGPDGAIEFTYTFKVAGTDLTGSMTTPMGDLTISEGKVTGDDFSFVVKFERDGQSFPIQYKGKVAGDEVTLTSQFGERSFEQKLNRVKS